MAVLHTKGNMITGVDLDFETGQVISLSGFTLKNEKEEKKRVLKQARGNKKLAAKILGIGRMTLYNKMNEYGLNNYLQP